MQRSIGLVLTLQLLALSACGAAEHPDPTASDSPSHAVDDSKPSPESSSAPSTRQLEPMSAEAVYFEVGGSLGQVWALHTEGLRRIDTETLPLDRVIPNPKGGAWMWLDGAPTLYRYDGTTVAPTPGAGLPNGIHSLVGVDHLNRLWGLGDDAVAVLEDPATGRWKTTPLDPADKFRPQFVFGSQASWLITAGRLIVLGSDGPTFHTRPSATAKRLPGAAVRGTSLILETQDGMTKVDLDGTRTLIHTFRKKSPLVGAMVASTSTGRTIFVERSSVFETQEQGALKLKRRWPRYAREMGVLDGHLYGRLSNGRFAWLPLAPENRNAKLIKSPALKSKVEPLGVVSDRAGRLWVRTELGLAVVTRDSAREFWPGSLGELSVTSVKAVRVHRGPAKLPTFAPNATANLRGRLVLASGEPVARGRVEVCTNVSWPTFYGRTPCDGEGFAASARLDKDGRFALTDIPKSGVWFVVGWSDSKSGKLAWSRRSLDGKRGDIGDFAVN